MPRLRPGARSKFRVRRSLRVKERLPVRNLRKAARALGARVLKKRHGRSRNPNVLHLWEKAVLLGMRSRQLRRSQEGGRGVLLETRSRRRRRQHEGKVARQRQVLNRRVPAAMGIAGMAAAMGTVTAAAEDGSPRRMSNVSCPMCDVKWI